MKHTLQHTAHKCCNNVFILIWTKYLVNLTAIFTSTHIVWLIYNGSFIDFDWIFNAPWPVKILAPSVRRDLWSHSINSSSVAAPVIDYQCSGISHTKTTLCHRITIKQGLLLLTKGDKPIIYNPVSELIGIHFTPQYVHCLHIIELFLSKMREKDRDGWFSYLHGHVDWINEIYPYPHSYFNEHVH